MSKKDWPRLFRRRYFTDIAAWHASNKKRQRGTNQKSLFVGGVNSDIDCNNHLYTSQVYCKKDDYFADEQGGAWTTHVIPCKSDLHSITVGGFSGVQFKIMHTFFSLKIKETNDQMRLMLKSHVEPFLKGHGWHGRGSKFKRIANNQYQTLEFQFNKYGGSFAVNLGVVEPTDNFYSASSRSLKFIRSQRLGSLKKRIAKRQNMDHWFNFMVGILIYVPAYKRAALEVINVYIAQADLTFESMQQSINAGVLCIHLEQV